MNGKDMDLGIIMVIATPREEHKQQGEHEAASEAEAEAEPERKGERIARATVGARGCWRPQVSACVPRRHLATLLPRR